MNENNKMCAVSVGDVIPYRTSTGYVIPYIVEKVTINMLGGGEMKIRCRHGDGGANRSFTGKQARNLIKTDGKEM